MGKNIFIVEDLPMMRDLLSTTLESLGHTVVGVAENGKDAIANYAQHNPDLMTLDISLPDMDGLQLTQRIREDSQYSELPILMLTVRALVIEQIRGYNRGADEYVTKPFEREVLLARLKALERRST